MVMTLFQLDNISGLIGDILYQPARGARFITGDYTVSIRGAQPNLKSIVEFNDFIQYLNVAS